MTDFDAKARRWDADPVKGQRALRVAEVIRQEVSVGPDTSVFEYGCGTGLLGFALRPYVGRVVLADTSRGMLEVLREKIAAAGARDMTPLRLDLLTDPLPAERYDLVCTLLTLHHVPDTDGLLARFRALLAPGGVACVCDLDREDGSFHGPEVDVHHGFDRPDLERRLRRAGFRTVRFRTPGEIVKATPAGPRHYPLFLAVAG